MSGISNTDKAKNLLTSLFLVLTCLFGAFSMSGVHAESESTALSRFLSEANRSTAKPIAPVKNLVRLSSLELIASWQTLGDYPFTLSQYASWTRPLQEIEHNTPLTTKYLVKNYDYQISLALQTAPLFLVSRLPTPMLITNTSIYQINNTAPLFFTDISLDTYHPAIPLTMPTSHITIEMPPAPPLKTIGYKALPPIACKAFSLLDIKTPLLAPRADHTKKPENTKRIPQPFTQIRLAKWQPPSAYLHLPEIHVKIENPSYALRPINSNATHEVLSTIPCKQTDIDLLNPLPLKSYVYTPYPLMLTPSKPQPLVSASASPATWDVPTTTLTFPVNRVEVAMPYYALRPINSSATHEMLKRQPCKQVAFPLLNPLFLNTYTRSTPTLTPSKPQHFTSVHLIDHPPTSISLSIPVSRVEIENPSYDLTDIDYTATHEALNTPSFSTNRCQYTPTLLPIEAPFVLTHLQENITPNTEVSLFHLLSRLVFPQISYQDYLYYKSYPTFDCLLSQKEASLIHITPTHTPAFDNSTLDVNYNMPLTLSAFTKQATTRQSLWHTPSPLLLTSNLDVDETSDTRAPFLIPEIRNIKPLPLCVPAPNKTVYSHVSASLDSPVSVDALSRVRYTQVALPSNLANWDEEREVMDTSQPITIASTEVFHTTPREIFPFSGTVADSSFQNSFTKEVTTEQALAKKSIGILPSLFSFKSIPTMIYGGSKCVDKASRENLLTSQETTKDQVLAPMPVLTDTVLVNASNESYTFASVSSKIDIPLFLSLPILKPTHLDQEPSLSQYLPVLTYAPYLLPDINNGIHPPAAFTSYRAPSCENPRIDFALSTYSLIPAPYKLAFTDFPFNFSLALINSPDHALQSTDKLMNPCFLTALPNIDFADHTHTYATTLRPSFSTHSLPSPEKSRGVNSPTSPLIATSQVLQAPLLSDILYTVDAYNAYPYICVYTYDDDAIIPMMFASLLPSVYIANSLPSISPETQVAIKTITSSPSSFSQGGSQSGPIISKYGDSLAKELTLPGPQFLIYDTSYLLSRQYNNSMHHKKDALMADFEKVLDYENICLEDHYNCDINYTYNNDEEQYEFEILLSPKPKQHYPETAQNFIFVLDGSAPINKDRYEGFKKGIIKSLSYLKPGDSCALLLVDNKISSPFDKPRLVTKSFKQSVAHDLASLKYLGYYPEFELSDMMESAKEYFVKARENVVIVLSDAHTFANMRSTHRFMRKFSNEQSETFSLYTASCKSRENLSQMKIVSELHQGQLCHSPTIAAFPRNLAMLVKHATNTISSHIEISIDERDNDDMTLYPTMLSSTLFSDQPFKLYGSTKELDSFSIDITAHGKHALISLPLYVDFDRAYQSDNLLPDEIKEQKAISSLHESYFNDDTAFFKAVDVIIEHNDPSAPLAFR